MKTIPLDGTLQVMRSIFAQGSGHGLYPWALGVMDASLLLPRAEMHSSNEKKYDEGYDLRMKEILSDEQR